MPCGPKKRRAAKRKNDVDSEEKPVVSEDVNVEAVDELIESENMKRSQEVPVTKEAESVGNKGKETESEFISEGCPLNESESGGIEGNGSEQQSVGDENIMHGVVLDRVITEGKTSESVEPISKEKQENECGEGGECACDVPPAIVNNVVSVVQEGEDSLNEPEGPSMVSHVESVVKDDREISMDAILQHPYKDSLKSFKEPSGCSSVVEMFPEGSNCYKNELVGVLKTMFVEVERMKDSYERISFQISQLLEKLDSDNLT